jgi:nucleotide-binding universal stress UspA family protein
MQRFKNILFVAESTDHSSAALKRAVTLAINNQASLTIIGVVAALPRHMKMAITAVTPAELLDMVVAERRHELMDMAKAVTPNDRPLSVVKVLVGDAFIEIIREVLRNDHDLVIKPVEDHGGIKRTLFGSSDMHLLRKCPCPVWIVKPSAHEHYRNILAAVDRDPEDVENDALNRQILEMSTSLALAEFSELHVVHAWSIAFEDTLRSPRAGYSLADVDAILREEENSHKRWLDDLLHQFRVRDVDAVKYLTPQLHLVKGNPRYEVPKLAAQLNVELIVLGTVGRVGIPGLLMGNTAEEILAQIDCSVLAIKPPGFVSPVSLP